MKFWNERTKKLTPYIPGEQPSPNERTIKLNTNESPFPAAKRVRKAIQKIPASRYRLYPDPSARALREAAALRYGVSPNAIVATNGSDEALSYIVCAFADAKKEMILSNPTYTVYETLALRFGVPYRVIETEPDFSIDLKKIPNHKNALFFIANPNAQTGLYIPVEALIAFVKTYKGLVIVDEAYVDFGAQSAVPFINECDNLIVTRTFSKSFSLCGLRAGLTFAHVTLTAALTRVKDSYNVNLLTQCAATEALHAYDEMQKNASIVVREREALYCAFSRMGCVVLPSKANFLLVAPHPVSASDMYAALKRKGILVRYFNTPRLSRFVRISVGSVKHNRALLKAFAEIAGTEQ